MAYRDLCLVVSHDGSRPRSQIEGVYNGRVGEGGGKRRGEGGGEGEGGSERGRQREGRVGQRRRNDGRSTSCGETVPRGVSHGFVHLLPNCVRVLLRFRQLHGGFLEYGRCLHNLLEWLLDQR